MNLANLGKGIEMNVYYILCFIQSRKLTIDQFCKNCDIPREDFIGIVNKDDNKDLVNSMSKIASYITNSII